VINLAGAANLFNKKVQQIFARFPPCNVLIVLVSNFSISNPYLLISYLFYHGNLVPPGTKKLPFY